jgi:geranylgeranyl transferase type-2 subunit alpha
MNDLTILLSINPEFYTAWNYRKEIIQNMDFNEDMLLEELQLLEKSLKEGAIKSYSVWFHRFWVIKRIPKLWEKELKLCNLLLDYDDRNCKFYLNQFIVGTTEGIFSSC